MEIIKINSSNRNKIKEYQKYLGNLPYTTLDLPEPDADPYTIVAYKASQFESGTLVEDTVLEIDGEDFGHNIKWLLDDVDKHIGKKAIYEVYIGVKTIVDGLMFVACFKGSVSGEIVAPRGNGFGFDPYFKPDGIDKTLGEEKNDVYNARVIAIKRLLSENADKIMSCINEWDGEWQEGLNESLNNPLKRLGEYQPKEIEENEYMKGILEKIKLKEY